MAITYAQWLGNGTSLDGKVDAPKHADASYFFVNPEQPAGDGLDPSTPKSLFGDIFNGGALAPNNNHLGHQVMIAQGMDHYLYDTDDLRLDLRLSGFDPTRPGVIQTYDPADPWNQDKWGRPDEGQRPRIIQSSYADGDSELSCLNGLYLLFRGFQIGQYDPEQTKIDWFFRGATGEMDYIVLENIVAENCELICEKADGTSGRIPHFAMHHCGVFGAWNGTANAVVGTYFDYTDAHFAGCAYWHNGWKRGVLRTALQSLGGPINRHHNWYGQTGASSKWYECLSVSPASDAFKCRGPSLTYRSASIGAPIPHPLGGGTLADMQEDWPDGALIEAFENFSVGGDRINPTMSHNGHYGIFVTNAAEGSHATRNLLVRSDYASPTTDNPCWAHDDQGVASTFHFDGNVAFAYGHDPQYDVGLTTTFGEPNVYTSDAGQFTNPYTKAELLAYLSDQTGQTFTTEDDFGEYAVQRPLTNWASMVRGYAGPGYDMAWSDLDGGFEPTPSGLLMPTRRLLRLAA